MLAVHRSKGALPYSDLEAEILERFANHLYRAIQIYRRFIEVQKENYHLYRLLEQIKVGIILLGYKKKCVLVMSWLKKL